MHVFYLLSSNGKLLVTKARLERVWTRLADRLAIVVADTSMITILPEYAGHFCDLYINGKENVKLTGNCMKMFMLTPPFMLRYLIILIQMMYTYPILRPYLSIFIHALNTLYLLYQVTLVYAAIDRANPCSLHGFIAWITSPTQVMI